MKKIIPDAMLATRASTAVGLLGDPPLHRSALAEFWQRPAPRGPSIPIRPDAAAAPMRDDAAKNLAARREYEKIRKRRWRQKRAAAGLPYR
jgi:hypothetical protein